MLRNEILLGGERRAQPAGDDDNAKGAKTQQRDPHSFEMRREQAGDNGGTDDQRQRCGESGNRICPASDSVIGQAIDERVPRRSDDGLPHAEQTGEREQDDDPPTWVVHDFRETEQHPGHGKDHANGGQCRSSPVPTNKPQHEHLDGHDDSGVDSERQRDHVIRDVGRDRRKRRHPGVERTGADEAEQQRGQNHQTEPTVVKDVSVSDPSFVSHPFLAADSAARATAQRKEDTRGRWQGTAPERSQGDGL